MSSGRQEIDERKVLSLVHIDKAIHAITGEGLESLHTDPTQVKQLEVLALLFEAFHIAIINMNAAELSAWAMYDKKCEK
jgi:hypothetical protein